MLRTLAFFFFFLSENVSAMTSQTRDSTSFGCLLKSYCEQSLYSFLGRVLGANHFRCSLPAAVYPLLGNPQQMPLMHRVPQQPLHVLTSISLFISSLLVLRL